MHLTGILRDTGELETAAAVESFLRQAEMLVLCPCFATVDGGQTGASQQAQQPYDNADDENNLHEKLLAEKMMIIAELEKQLQVAQEGVREAKVPKPD